jgi:hypothetical protein
MARTHLTDKQIRAPYNAQNNTAIVAKLTDVDTSLDALETTVNGSTDYKASCRFATTASVTLASVGLTVTDGVTPVAGDRVLVKDQSTAKQNGIYVVSATAWTRATDADASADVTSGMQVFVSEGTVNGGRWFQLTTADPIVLGTDDLTFTDMPSADLLASTSTGEGASLVGIEDAAPGYFTAANVEAALREIWTKLIVTTTPGGASYIGVFDTAGKYTADTVEACLAEVKTIADAAMPTATLALTTTGNGADLIGAFDTGGIYTATTVNGQLQEVKALADAGIALAKKTVTVKDEDAGMTGASYVVNIGTALPANAVVLAHEYVIAEQFSGEADTTLEIGGTDTDAIVANFDLDAAGAGSYQGTLGVHPQGSFGGQQLVATFAATALEDLTAGEITITVWYSVLA